MPIAVVGVFALAAVHNSHAQSVRPGTVAPVELQRSDPIAWLESGDLRQQAWGAWFAGRLLQREAIPQLLSVVAHHVDQTSVEESLTTDVAIDALIELDADLPIELIERIAERRPEPALVLLTKHKDADWLLLAIMRRESGNVWLGAANLALARRVRGLAAAWLEKLELSAYLMVADDDSRSLGGFGGGGSSACRGAMQPPVGYPPWPSYQLMAVGVAGARVLATGPMPVYFQRQFWGSAGRSTISGPETYTRLKYLAALLGVKETELPLRPWTSQTVKWRDHASLEIAVAGLRERVIENYRALVATLVTVGVLSHSEAQMLPLPDVTIRVNDLRADKALSLGSLQR